MRVPREVCPRCGQVGSGIFWKMVGSRGRAYRYAYFAHHYGLRRLRWCYLGRRGFARSRGVGSVVADRLLSEVLASYVECLRGRFGGDLVAAALFGSAARGEAEFPRSDIDLLVVLRGVEGRSLAERVRLVSEVEGVLREGDGWRGFVSAYGEPLFQALVLSPSEVRRHPPILLDLVTDGIVLCDEGLLGQELRGLGARLQELGAERRRLADGSSYWRLKRDVGWGEVLEL